MKLGGQVRNSKVKKIKDCNFTLAEAAGRRERELWVETRQKDALLELVDSFLFVADADGAGIQKNEG